MEDNIQNVYKKLVSFGYNGTEDEFRNYISVDSNIPNVYNKLVSFGYNGTEDEFRNYIGRVDVSDVQQAEQGNTTVAEATEIPTVTMEQMESAEHYQPRVGGAGMKTPEELEAEAQQAEPYREKPQTLTPPEVLVDNEIEDDGIRKSREKLGLSNNWGSAPFGRDKDGKPIQWNPQGRPDIVTQHEDGTKEYNFSPESVAEMNNLGKYIAYQSQELAPDIAEVARKKAVDPNYQVPAELKAKIDEINQATKFYDEYEKAYKQSPFHEINEQIALKESDEALAELRGRQIASWTGAFAKTVGAGITLQGSQELAPSPLDYVFGKKFHDDMLKQSEEMRQQGEEQLGKASLLMMTAQELEQAKNTIRLSQRNQDGAGYYPRQLWYGLVYSNLTGLDQISSMSGAFGLANIAEKLDENGQPKVPLTEEEKLAYDALVFNSAVQQRFGDNITMFNRIGQSMPENTAYVLDFVIGSHMGAGAVGKGASRMTKNAIGGVVKKQVKNGALRFTLDKALPTAVEMGAQATYRTMLDMPFVYSDATRRSVGTMAVDPETMQAYGFRGGEDMGAAMSDAWWARFIDNGSESLGDMVFEPGVGMVWRKVKDTQGGIKLQQARKWFGDLGNGKVDDMLRSVRNFNDQHGTGWQSAPIETLEEFSGGTMNALFVGDQELKEVYSSENMMETALNCFIFGVAQSSTITGLKRGFADLPNDVKLRSAKREAAAVINDMDNISVEDIEQHINEDEGNALADWLYSMNNEGNWNEQQRKAVMAYTQAAIMQKARNQMRQTKMREDIEKSDAEVDASVNDRSGNVILATFKLGDETMQGTVIKGRVSTMEEPVDDGNGNVSVSYRYNPHLSSATLAVRLKDGTVKMVGSKAITSIDAIEDPETLKERWRSGIIGEVEQEITKAATTPSISQLMGDFDFTQTGGTLSIQGQAYRFDGMDDNGNYTFTPLDEKGIADEDRKTTISEKSMRTMALLERLNAAIATNANDEEVEDIIEELKTEQELDNIEKSKDESNVWAELSQFLGKYVVLTEEGDFDPEKSDVAGAAGYLVSLKQGDINAAAAIVDERINELNMRLMEKPEGVQNNGEGVVGMAVNSNAAEGMAKQAAQAVSFLQDVRQAIGEMQQEKAEQNAEKPVSELDKDDIFPVEMNGQRYWAQVDGHTEDGPVVSLFDNERTEGEPVEAAIDNMTYEQWEAVRVAMASQQTGQEEAVNTPPAEQESAGIEQKEPEITPKPLENESNPQEEISGNEGNISPVSTESSTEEAEESAQRDNVPTASQDEGQTESAPVQPEAQVEPEAQQAVELPRDKDGNIDHTRLTPDDAAAYTAAVNEEADNAAAFAELGDAEYVKRNMEAAKKEVEKAEKTKPKSTGAAQLKKELADINNKRQAAKSLVAFWQAVEAEQNRRIAEAAAAQQEAEEAARREEEARRAEEARLASQGEGTTEVQPEEKKGLQGLEGYTESDVEDLVREHIESALEGMDADIEIVGVKVIGSRVNGNAREDSDLDVLVEYKGDMTEDGLFNLLNDKENRLYIEGIPVDINPITEGKSGTIEQFMARNAGYSKPTEGTAIESPEKEQNGEQANTPAAGQEELPAVEIKEKPKRPVRPSKFQKRIDAIGEPRTVEEAILLDIALGGAKFRWGNRNEDKKVMKRGIGDLWKYNNNEFKKRIGIVKKDGYSIETYAEAILAGRLMGYSGAVSQIAEGKDMRDLIDIIEDVLQMTTTKADALEALESKRAEEAEEEQRYIRAMQDAEAQEQGFENWDDKEAYQQSLEEKNLTDAEYEEYYRIFAEQTQEEDDQRRRQSESEGDSGENQPDERQGVHREHEGSPEVLQGTQTDDSGAVQQPRQDTRGQSGDIQDAGTPREPEGASEVRAEIEQLRTKRADLVRQRNEIQQRYEQANGLFGDTQADENDLFGGQNFLSPDLAQATIDGYNRKIKQIDEQIAKLEASLKRATSVKQAEIEENEGAFQKPDVDVERIKALRKALAEGYSKGDKKAIQRAVDALKQYVSEGLDTETWYSEEADDYEGDDPMMQAERYITHLYQDHYLDDDEDQEYIKTGLRSDGMTKLGGRMTADSPFYKLFEGVVDNATDGTEGTDSAVAAANTEVDTNPTEAQKEAGNYKKGHVTIDGFDISIENPVGSTRSGTDAQGNPWSVTMHNSYGYIRMTEGVDGDHIDIFLSDHIDDWNGTVYVVDQVNEDGSFDEHKVMYGFNSEEEAREAYLSNYSEGWQGLGTITGVSREEFKKWVDSSHRKTKAFADYKSVQTTEGQGEAAMESRTERTEPYNSFAELVADTEITVTDPSTIDKMRKIVDKFFTHGSSNIRHDALGADYNFVYLADYLNKAEAKLLEPFATQGTVEYNDNNKTATWVDEEQQRIYFIKYSTSTLKLGIAGYIELAKTKETSDSTEEQLKLPNTTSKDVPAKIDDVGEKIGGARKDLAQQMSGKIKLDADTFPKMFPKFDLKKLVEQGLDPKMAAAVMFLRQSAYAEYKQKNKRQGKVKALAAAKFFAAYAKQVLEKGDTDVEFTDSGWVFTDYGKIHVRANIALYGKIHDKMGNDMFDVDLTGYEILPVNVDSKSTYTAYRKNENGENVPFKPAYVTKTKSRTSYFKEDELDQAIDEVVKMVDQGVSYDKSHPYKLSVYYTRGKENSFYVGVKIGNEVKALTEPGSLDATRTYLDEHEAELQAEAARVEQQTKEAKKNEHPVAKVEIVRSYKSQEGTLYGYVFAVKIDKGYVNIMDDMFDLRTIYKYEKEHHDELQEKAQQILDQYLAEKESGKGWKPQLNLGGGRARVGEDYRKGRDIGAEEFRETFGFRGVEFGNYVTQKERQRYLNEAYDAFMDLAELLGVSPKALSLGGQLGFAIGARGGGGKNAAHYEPELNVINLTKTQGAGSVAHEWWHALDFYFNRRNGERKRPATGNTKAESFDASVRREMAEAFVGLMEKINNSEYFRRSKRLDNKTNRQYFATDTELGARAFQDYVQRRLTERGQVNDFLSSFTPEERWNGEETTYPYPTGEEANAIDERFDNLFSTMEEREEDGKTVLFSIREEAAPEKTKKVYKLMRLEDGKLYPLFIDRKAMPIELGVWYNADSPEIADLENLEAGYAYKIDKDGNVADQKPVNRTEKGSITGLPNVKTVNEAAEEGARWITVTTNKAGEKTYHNVGINGSEGVSTFAMRPGWHAGSLPSMRQIGKGKNKDLRDSRFVWVEGEVAADVDYQAEADANPNKDIATHIPANGYYMKATNADKVKSQADRIGWYISGAFKPNRVISDAEARQVIDEYNAAHPEAPVDYDYEREGGVEFTEEDAKRVNGSNKTEAKEIAYNAVREALAKAGIEVEVATEEEVEKMKAEMKTLQDSKGVVRGWVGNDGKIHLTKDGLDAETPIHEYTHLWAEVLQMTNPDLWEQIKGLLKGTPEWQRITSMKEYSNLKDDDRIAGEVLAHISGKKNAERMEAEAKRMIDEAPTLEEAAKAATLLGRMREAMKKFWTWVGKTLLGKKGNITVDQVTEMVLADLTNGIDPFHPRGGKRTKRTEASVDSEMERIKRDAQANGTFMKAPNGKPTKLTERQWLQVRTKAFKKWFGDWELAAKVVSIVSAAKEHGFKNFDEARKWAKENIVGSVEQSEIGEVNISGTAIDKYLSQKAVDKSDNKDVHLSALRVMPQIIKHSLVGEIHEDKNNIPQLKDIVRLYSAIDIDGKTYRVKTTVKRYNDSDVKSKAYSYEVTEIELLDGTLGENASLPRTSNNSISGAKLLQNVKSETDGGKYLLDSSKIVDENGEPMVVYHGGKGEITVFDKNRIGENLDYGTMGSGFYFTSDRENAENYARNAQGEEEPTVVEAFLNIRNAKDVNWNELDGESQKKSVAFTDKAIAKGHDGFTAIAPNKAQWIVAFNPNQIKSATENNGEFDAGNDDIRFSISSVGEEQLSLFLQNNSGEYETQDGEKIGYISLLGLEDDVLSAGESNAVDGDRRNGMERGDNLPEYHLRRLEPGETCRVERRYQKSKMFDFTGSDKIETIDDVAYIFKKLEDAAVENAFIVLVKDGKPTIIHAGIGGYDYSPVNIGSALSAYKNIEPDAVWFVHNHPGGSITCSLQDRQVADNFRRVFGEKFKAGIIIDTTSGKYGVFDETIGDITNGSTRTQPENETAIDVYEFSKQVFDEDWDPTEAFKVRNSLDVATFVSSHRLGEHDKMSLLVLNNNHNVVGNIFLPYTRLGEANKEQLAEDIMYYANQMAGTKVIIYGDFLNKDIRGTGNYIKERVQYANIKLMDVVSTNEAYTEYKSAKDMGLFAFEEDSAMANEVREDIPDSSRMAVRDEFDEISGAHPKDKAKTIRQKWEQLLTDQVNKYRPLKQLEELLAKKKGRKLRDSESFYSRATMTAARTLPQMEAEREIYLLLLEQAVDKVFSILDPNGRRTGRKTKQADGSRENSKMMRLRQRVADYLIAKHGLERNDWFFQEALKDYEERMKKYEEWLKTKAQYEYAEFESKYGAKGKQGFKVSYEGYIAARKPKEPSADDKSGLIGLAESLNEDPKDFKAVAEDLVAAFEDEVGQDAIDNLWKEINGFTNRLLEMSYNDGFTDRDHYEDLKGRWKYYVPLRGFDNGTSDDLYYYTTQGGDSAVTMLKAKGRTSKAEDPLIHLVRMQEQAVTMGNDNWAKTALYNAAINLPSDLLRVKQVWYTQDPNTGEIIEHYADLNGLTKPDDIDAAIKQFNADMKAAGAKRRLNKADVGKRIRPQNLGEHEIEVWVNGKKVIIEVNGNPSLVRAYSESQDELKGFIKGVQKANRLEARLFTTWNPEFAVKNMMRDTNFALFSAFVNGGVRQWKDTWANIHTARLILPKLMKDGTVSKTLVRDDSERQNLEKWYREFIDNGGETGFTRTMSAEQVSKDLNDTLRALAKGNEDGVTKMEKLAGVVEELNRWAENSTRFAAYITAREKGESVTKAMDAAKNSTLNFNIKGYEGKRLRAWFCFFNARLQGVAQLARLAKQNPKRFAIGLGAAVLTGAMVPFLNILTLGLGGDDDDWKTYEYLSEYTGNNNLVIFIPGIHKFVAIPYSQELAPFSAQGNIWFREATGWNRNKSAWQQELEMNLAYLPMEVNLSDKEDTWPMLGSTAVRTVSPTIMQPLVEYAVNENFMNMPLRRDSKYKSNLAAWTTAYESRTSGALIKASKWLNGGSSENKWGKAEVLIDPSFIQHVVEGTAGGVGSFVGNARDLFTEPDWFNHLPFVRKFMFDGDPKKWQGGLDRAYSAYAYDFIDERDKKIDAIRYDNQSTLDYARQMWAEHNSTDKVIYDLAKDYRDNLGKYKEKENGHSVNKSNFGENPYRYKDNGKDLLPIIGLKGMRQYYRDLREHDADEEEIERVRGMINEYELEMLEEIDAVYYEQHVQGKKPVSESLRKMVEDARGGK